MSMVTVTLTPAQARMLFAAAVKFDADHEDVQDRVGSGVTVGDLRTLQRGRQAIVRAAMAADVDLR